MIELRDCDSIIFDMDGTLWDAVDSYCKIWDATFEQMGFKVDKIPRQTLLECMGLPIDEIFRRIVTINVDATKFLELLDENERDMMPILGGQLYNGVFDGIKRLASTYKLFMVSNCGADGLKNFLNFTQLEPYFVDTLTFGETHLSKTDNIKLIVSRNKLGSPVYVGDTQGDCDAAHQARLPMVFARYGFGSCCNAEFEVDTFSDLVKLFIKE